MTLSQTPIYAYVISFTVCWGNVTKINTIYKTKTKENTYKDIPNNNKQQLTHSKNCL